MRIDVWSDVVCPWCWIGKARLEKAIASFAHAGDVEVVFRSFELDPSTPKDLDISTDEMLAKKFGVARPQIDAMHERLRGLGRADGVDFQFERARTSNTFDAHQVLQLAKSQGKQLAMSDRLFRANFAEGVRIGARQELVRLATEVGLDGGDVAAALDEERFAAAVREDEAQARALGITGVPFFVVGGAIGVSGAQSMEVLHQALEQAWASRPAPAVAKADGTCGDDGCEVQEPR
jgi:predicted DsbA family dithiol-disulfide isomerase